MTTIHETDVDSPVASALLDDYFAERAAGFPPEQGVYRPSRPDPEQFRGERGVFLVLEDDELGSVGCGGLRRLDAPELVCFEVKHLFLKPVARGRGYGGAVLDAAIRIARERGAQSLVLDTNASLAAAGALYRKRGFEHIAPYNDNPNATDWYELKL